MSWIQNSYFSTPTPINRTFQGLIGVSCITVVALSIIGLTATPLGPFNSITQLGIATHAVLLGTSVFVLILDLIWIAAIVKKTKESSASQFKSSELGSPKTESSNAESSSAVERIEEINEADIISQTIDELILKIFGYLNPIELAKCKPISRRWRRFACDENLWNAFDLRKISPQITVFDESDWAAHVDLTILGFKAEEPLSKSQVIPVLIRSLAVLARCHSNHPIEGDAGITILTMPQGLTYNHLVRLIGSSRKGGKIKFGHIHERITSAPEDFLNMAVNKTYRVVITNSVFCGTRRRFFQDQQVLLDEIGCGLPTMLEVATLIGTKYIESGQHQFVPCDDYNTITTTRCLDKVGDFQLVAGSYSRDKLAISYDFSSNISDFIGIAGVLQRF